MESFGKVQFLENEFGSLTKDPNQSHYIQKVLLSTFLLELFLIGVNRLEDEVMKLEIQYQDAISSSSILPSNTSPSASSNINTNTTAILSSSSALISDLVHPVLQTLPHDKNLTSQLTSLKVELDLSIQELYEFLTKYSGVLDPSTTHRLCTTHGQMSASLHFLIGIQKVNQVVGWYISQGKFELALSTLLTCRKESETWYKFGGVLMEKTPYETVGAWIRKGDTLDPQRLIPALLRYDPRKSIGKKGIEGQVNRRRINLKNPFYT